MSIEIISITDVIRPLEKDKVQLMAPTPSVQNCHKRYVLLTLAKFLKHTFKYIFFRIDRKKEFERKSFVEKTI